MQDKYAHIYARLATLIDSGTTVSEAFSIIAETESSRFARGLFRAAEVIDSGGTFQEALQKSLLFERFEIRMLTAGEKSGRLPEICRRLSEHRERKMKRLEDLLFRMAYPVVLVHLAVLGPSLFVLIRDGARAYCETVLPVLGFIYFLVALPFLLIRISRPIPSLDYFWNYLFLNIPMVGGYILKSQLAHSITVWQGLYASGVSILVSLEDVIRATKNPVIRSIFQRILQRMLAGQNLAIAVTAEKSIPGYVRNMISTGETSGHLEENLLKARNILDEEAETAVKILMSTVSTLIFLGAAVFVGYKIVSFYSGYFQQIRGIMGSGGLGN